MAKLLSAHWPHLIFVVIGVVVFLWSAYRPEGTELDDSPEVEAARPQRRQVKRTAARRGLLALGPLVAAVGTGAALYGIALAGASEPAAVIWVHSGISALALALVVYKVSDLGLARVRRAFTREGLPELVSIALAVVSVPLAVTGIGLLVSPSTDSAFAYTHLISSAWWTGLLVWHLRRYLVPSLRAASRGREGSPAAASSAAASASPLS